MTWPLFFAALGGHWRSISAVVGIVLFAAYVWAWCEASGSCDDAGLSEWR